VEHLGSFGIVTIGRDGHRLRVIVENGQRPVIGDEVGLGLADDALHLFEPATGQRLHQQGPGA
jgi:hypothetical protein